MTDLTEQQREALAALDRLEHDSDYAEWEDRPEDDVLYGANTLRDWETVRAAILNSTPVPVPEQKVPEDAPRYQWDDEYPQYATGFDSEDMACAWADGWNACRESMIQAASKPEDSHE